MRFSIIPCRRSWAPFYALAAVRARRFRTCCRSIALRVQAAHARKQAREAEKRVDVGRREAEALPDLLHRADDGIELDQTSSFHVLQHRGLEGTELGSAGVAVFRGLLDRAADALTDDRRFVHRGGAERAHQRI